MSKTWILTSAAAAVLLLAIGCGDEKNREVLVDPPKASETAPATTDAPATAETAAATTSLPMKSVDAAGLGELIASYKGKKPIVVNIWATYCAPCVAEFPHFAKLGKENADVEMIFISGDFADEPEEMEKAQAFLAEQGVTWQSYIIADLADQAFFPALSKEWTGTMPATLIVAKDGTEIAFQQGEMDSQTLHDHVANAIAHDAATK